MRLLRKLRRLFKKKPKPIPIEEQEHSSLILVRFHPFEGRETYRKWVRPIRWNPKTVIVELPSGNIIKRRRREVIK